MLVGNNIAITAYQKTGASADFLGLGFSSRHIDRHPNANILKKRIIAKGIFIHHRVLGNIF